MPDATELRDPDRLPSQRELHHWADYVELRCLAGSEHLLSPGQLLARLRLGRDIGEGTTAGTQGDDELDVETIDRLLGIQDDEPGGELRDVEWDEDLDEAPTPGGEEGPPSEFRDAQERRVQDIWAHLRYRSTAFGDSWPFVLDPRAQTLALRPTVSDPQRAYLFLLLCASLRYLDRSRAQRFTSAFELFSFEAFRTAFPAWEVHVFGTTAPTGSRYEGTLWTKVQRLASDLRCRLLVDEREFQPGDSGDNGLDLVAWLPMPDNSKGMPTAFAQCACGASEWKSKQGEAADDHWGESMKISVPLQNWTFIPFCYHDPRGDWEVPRRVAKGVLVDRLRALTLLDGDVAGAVAVLPDDPLLRAG